MLQHVVWNCLHKWNGHITKPFIRRSMTHFQYRNDVLSFDFCVSQSYDDKDSLTKFNKKCTQSDLQCVSSSLYVIHVYDSRKSYHGTSPEPSINWPWVTNKDYSIWSCPKMGKYWEKNFWVTKLEFFGKSVHRLITDINKSLTRIQDCSLFHIQMHQMSLHIKSANLIS